MFRPGITRGFRAEAFFRPASVVLVDGPGGLGARVAANMAGFPGGFRVVATGELPLAGAAPELAVLACAPEEVAGALLALGRGGTYAVVCLVPAPGLAAAAVAAGVRVLGPASFGLVVPGTGLNATGLHVPVGAGRLALVSQSAGLCRAVLDWAGPNGVGFSHVIGTGGNVDRGFSLALDWLSRDPGTGGILLDVRTVRDRHTLLAAARAAARLRPVVAIRAGGRLGDPSGREDAVFDAALRRVGVVRVSGLANLLGAAEVLTRARPPRGEALAIVTNAVGPGHMAADAAVGMGLPLARLDGTARVLLQLHLPEGPADPGIVWTGADGPIRVAEAAAMLAGLKEVGGIVAILSPTGEGDAAAVAALAACRPSLKVPLLACVLGQTTGGAFRGELAAAGLPVFATPESAVRAFATMVEQRRAQAAAAELPPRRVLALAPDHAAVARIIAGARAEGRDGLAQDEALAVLAAYGMAVVPVLRARTPAKAAEMAARLGFPVVLKRVRHGRPDAGLARAEDGPAVRAVVAADLGDAAAVWRTAAGLKPEEAPEGMLVQKQVRRGLELRITVGDDKLFGPALGFGLGGPAAALVGDVSYELPPLNLVLARSLIARTRAGGLLAVEQPAVDAEVVADALVRVSQLMLDHPEIGAVDVNPFLATNGAGGGAADAWIGLRPEGVRSEFAVTAYPAELAEAFAAGGERLLIRPIRPEDAEAHQALFGRLGPEDIRYRFFNMLRELPPMQVARMTQVDYEREMAFVAVRESTGETVGVARLVREPGTEGGEFAVVVDPAMKGRGLARRLMEMLKAWGATKGMSTMTGQVLAENAPMLAFMRRMGATIRRMPEEPEVVEAVIAVG